MGSNGSKKKKKGDAKAAEDSSVGSRYAQSSMSKKISEQGVKLVLLGEMSAGKTSVVLRLVKNTFPDKVEPTIG